MTKINAQIVADSLSPQGERLTSLLITFPRFILAEVNTHRMLSKNTSSSRAIPFNKMVESVKNDPFIPIAWQKHHSGMQGNEYFNEDESKVNERVWLEARDSAVENAQQIYDYEITKQLANRILEPFMWTTMLITGSKEGWNNFFNLRCPQYEHTDWVTEDNHGIKQFSKSKKEYISIETGGHYHEHLKEMQLAEYDWLKINKGQAEIHMMALAECIYDVMNESTPVQLEPGEWHVPFAKNLDLIELAKLHSDADQFQEVCVKIATAMAARTSYTVVGDEKTIDYQRMIDLHDRLIAQDPPHSSPMEHCARAMTEREYESYRKHSQQNEAIVETISYGICRNYKGFIQYREIVENKWFN